MWIIQEKNDGNWFAGKYTTELVGGKIARVWLDEVTGTKRQALDLMLSYHEQISLVDLKVALDTMDENGDDTACFGVLGGFIMTKNEQESAAA